MLLCLSSFWLAASWHACWWLSPEWFWLVWPREAWWEVFNYCCTYESPLKKWAAILLQPLWPQLPQGPSSSAHLLLLLLLWRPPPPSPPTPPPPPRRSSLCHVALIAFHFWHLSVLAAAGTRILCSPQKKCVRNVIATSFSRSIGSSGPLFPPPSCNCIFLLLN